MRLMTSGTPLMLTFKEKFEEEVAEAPALCLSREFESVFGFRGLTYQTGSFHWSIRFSHFSSLLVRESALILN